ncbi:hypothetical protein Taro_024662 [Colocasia esculenta]|uniref:Uncharacterized protein n=1 Tax=Colocasia esculenta TaxID=4460 RepID=A0A843V6W4_COLES|nr:hypothetical protein [Colocasia esculenta]
MQHMGPLHDLVHYCGASGFTGGSSFTMYRTEARDGGYKGVLRSAMYGHREVSKRDCLVFLRRSMDASFATSPTMYIIHPHRPFLLRPATALPGRRHPPRRITIVADGSTAGNPPVEREIIPSGPLPSLYRSQVINRPIKKNVASDENQRTALPPPMPLSASSLAASLCNAWEDMVNKWLEPLPLRPSIDPEAVLAGNFAPVHELPPTPCPVVKGSIPHCLRGGAYVRNGPNPQHAPRGPHHLFDGDGMLHSLMLSADGGRSPAVMCSRFVRTQRYTVEREAGGPVFPNFFTFRGLAGAGRAALALARVLMGQLHPGKGISPGNVSLAFFHRRLFAFGEPDLPYAIHLSTHDGDVSTVGRANFGSRFFEGMTAHPKKDPDTGEVFAFRYRPIPPFLTYFRFDKDGTKQPDVPIFSVRKFSLFHDFAITKRFAIFPDLPIVVDYPGMVLGGGSLFRADAVKMPRIGVISRGATSGAEMKWFDVPGFSPIHILNSWEEEGEGSDGHAIVLVAPNMINVPQLLEGMEHGHNCVEMLRIDLKNNMVTRTPLSVKSLDMGVINAAYVGKKNRYAYLAMAGPFPKMKGVAKLDFELAKQNKDCVVACREYGPGCFGGEPFFVSKTKPGTRTTATW